jgi:hypothetical protein
MDFDSATRAIEALIADRAALVREAKPLHARYGTGGTFAEQRENIRAALAVEYRARLATHEGKVTQTMVDEAVRADADYIRFIDEAELARGELYVLYDQIRGVDHRIALLLARVQAPGAQWGDREGGEGAEAPPTGDMDS